MAERQTLIPAPLTPHRNARAGFIAGAGCYFIWGFVAIYFAMLVSRGVDAPHIVAYRIIWCAVFIAILLTASRQWRDVARVLRSRLAIAALAGSTLAIGANWWIYTYAVESRQLSYASLGYYMNPLVNVLLGVLLLGERLRRLQIAAVVLAAVGVGYQTFFIGHVPWISLGLAFSFGFYGLLRKTMQAGSLTGLMVETAMLAPIAILYLGIEANARKSPTITPGTHGLLALSGIVTATPLLLFAFAARRLKLSTLGFLQYFSPTIQLLLAIAYFGEEFTRARQITFGFIWAAVILFLTDQFLASRRSLPLAEPADMET